MNQNNNTIMTPITFTEAAELLLDGGKILFTAENNRAPEQPSFSFEIEDFQDLCAEYRKLRIEYFNIQLYKL